MLSHCCVLCHIRPSLIFHRIPRNIRTDPVHAGNILCHSQHSKTQFNVCRLFISLRWHGWIICQYVDPEIRCWYWVTQRQKSEISLTGYILFLILNKFYGIFKPCCFFTCSNAWSGFTSRFFSVMIVSTLGTSTATSDCMAYAVRYSSLSTLFEVGASE